MTFTDPWDYEAMLRDIRDRRRVAFVRYSDGDWNCLFHRVGRVVNEHEYLPDLGDALRACLKPEPGYHVGIMSSLFTPDRWWASNRVIAFVKEHPELQFCSSMILHCASQNGTLGRFFEAIKGQRLVMVGNERMKGMTPWLGQYEHVEIPAQECWHHRAEIEPRIIQAASAPGIVVLACAMPAKVWIRHAWEAGGQASLIDIGSVFDPYVGHLSRNYMRAGQHKLADKLYPA